MFEGTDIEQALVSLKEKTRTSEDKLALEAARILKSDLFTGETILENLKEYNKASEVIDEEDVDAAFVFTLPEIKKLAVLYRLKFLDDKVYKPEIPYEAILKIKALEARSAKEIKTFKVLAMPEAFINKENAGAALLFARTNYDHYFLVHRWGDRLNWGRKFKFWPLRTFENLFLCILALTLLITLSLPTRLITLDHKALYWSGYRAAAFFHLLIFNMGVTVFFTFSFSKNFSSSIWNSVKDFD